MMISAPRDSRAMVYVTAVIALMLGILPLPHWLSILRPQFLVLVVLYWSTMTPRAGGILLAFLAGICLDVFKGSQLGQHALALSFLAYLAIRLHLLTRAKPIFEQSLLVLRGAVRLRRRAVGGRRLERPAHQHLDPLGRTWSPARCAGP